MRSLTAKQLESQTLSIKPNLKVNLDNKIYKKTRIYLRKNYDDALKLCQTYEAKNLEVLLIEHKAYLAIWVEQPDEAIEKKENNPQKNQKVIKKYRGQKYEEEVEVANPKIDARKNKVIKQYRGQKYEEEVKIANPQKKVTKYYRGRAYE